MKEITIGTDQIVPILDPRKTYVMKINFTDYRNGKYVCNKIAGLWGFTDIMYLRDVHDLCPEKSLQESCQSLYNAATRHYRTQLFCFDTIQELTQYYRARKEMP